MKRCPRCGQTEPLDAFVRNRAAPNGIGAYCRPCHNEIGRANRTRVWGKIRFYHLKNRYGLTRVAFEQLWEEQGGKCAICLIRLANHVDHDQETGRVRGLLCFNCNGGLGQFGDDPTRLAMAVAYLHRVPDPPDQPAQVPMEVV